jgi:hypothetical protein
MGVEQTVVCLAGKTEVLGENRPQFCFVHHKSYMTDPVSNPSPTGGKPETDYLSYGTTFITSLHTNCH